MSYKKEMDDMTKIIDYSNTIKDDEMGARQKALLTQKWQLQYQINQIEPEILRVVATKCRGNPLLCFQYFINLLHNHFIIIQPDGLVMATSKFEHCLIINDWTAVPVPRLALKMNTQLLDNFYYSIQSKEAKNQRPGELQACTTSIVLLKAASVLGEEFELKALKYISPLSKSSNNSKRVEEAIRLLEQRDFIEIVDETDQRNCVCRFNKCFLRESVYQVLIYKSCKRDIHERTEKYIQQSPSLTSKQDNSILTEQLLQHMLLAQDAEQEKDLVYERRNALVVLRVQNIINMNPRSLVLKECLYKQGDAINKNVQLRICSLTQFALKWYHNDAREFEEDKFMGMVKLPFIYDVVKSKQAHNERPSFMISVTMYYDKKNEEKGKRDIFFSCDTTETRDKWMIAIDYLKTRAIYDAYAKKNTLANFFAQGNEQDDSGGDGDHEERDHSNLLYDFGDQLKNTTMGGPQQIFKNSLANNKLNSSIINDRKSSVMRLHASGIDSQQAKVTAHDLIPKLKLLYKVGMVSFAHHLQRQGFKSKAVIAKAANGGKQATQEDQKMLLPLSINWNIKNDIDDIMAQEPQMYTADRHGTQYSSRHGSEYNRETTSTVYHQNSHNSSENRRTAQRQKSSDNIPRDNIGPRRSSSISADHVQRAQQNQNVLPANNLIKELPDESDESEKGGGIGISRKNSKTSHRIKGRQSVEVQQAEKNQLSRVGVGSVHNSARKQLSINNYRNSEDSSLTPNSTPPLTNNLLGNQAQPRSSQVLSGSNPTQGKEENWNKIDIDDNGNSDDEEGFNPHVNAGDSKDRENRYTFASSHAGRDDSYHPGGADNTSAVAVAPKHHVLPYGYDGEAKDQVESHSHQESSSSTQNFPQKHNHRKANLSMQQHQNNHVYGAGNARHTHKQTASLGGTKSSAAQDKTGVDSFRQSSQNEYSIKSQIKPQARISGDRQTSIGKEADRRELSIIHHQQNQYDSRMYPDLIGNSMTLDPLINAPQQDKGIDEIHHQSLSAEAHSASQDSQNQKLISTISSMIKQKLDVGIKKMEQMAEQQQQLQEQMTLQQQQLLNSSFHTQVMMQQQQALASQQQTPTTNKFANQHPFAPQTGQSPHLVQHSVSALMPQSQYSAMMTSTGHQPAELFTPVRGADGGHLYPSAQHSASPYYNIYSAFNNTAVSEVSLGGGGITSKRRDKFLLDSASHPIQSKQEMDTEDEEPGDPMNEEVGSSRRAHHHYHHGNAAAGQQPLHPISFELDLREHKGGRNGTGMMGGATTLQPQNTHQHQDQLRGQLMMNVPQQNQQQLRSFHVPSSALNLNNHFMGGQLSDQDHHTDHEATIQSHQRQQPNIIMTQSTQNDVRTPPMYSGTGAYLTGRQNQPIAPNAPPQLSMQQQLQQNQAVAGGGDFHDSASAMTLKPTYPGASDHLSTTNMSNYHGHHATLDNRSGAKMTQKQQDFASSNSHGAVGQQFSMKQQQVNAYQQTPIKFADQPLVFPPPENWTETQYAMYEEPLSSSQYKTLKSATRAMAVRDSSDLRSEQIVIPRNAEVQVLEILPQAQICKVEYQGRIGIFKLQDFVSRDNTQNNSQMYQSNNDSINLSLQIATNTKSSPQKHQKANNKRTKKQSTIGNNTQHQLQPMSKSRSNMGPQSTQSRQSQIDQRQQQSNDMQQLTPPRTVSIDVKSQNLSARNAMNKGSVGANGSQSHRGGGGGGYYDEQPQRQESARMAKRSITMQVQDSTIEQMSSINGNDELEDQQDNHLTLANTSANAHRNFFRDEPEKHLSKQMRGLTAKELANYSKQFLEEDKAIHKQNNLKMVERQKRKAQIARRQHAEASKSHAAPRK